MKTQKIIQRSCLTLMLMMAMLFAMSITVSAQTVTVTGLAQTDATKSTATVSWSPSASGYLVWVDGQYKGQQTETSYTVSGMAAGKYAEVVVIGYNESIDADLDSLYSAAKYYNLYIYAYSTPGKPGNVANTKYNDTFNWNPMISNEVTVGWSINAKDTYYANGWQVLISTVDGKKKITTINEKGVQKAVVTTSFNKSAVKNKGFSIKVRGYLTLSNGKKKYGEWSASKVIIPQAKTKIKKGKSNSVKFSWTKIANATKYEVYVCKNTSVSNPKFKKVKTLSKKTTSYTLSKMKMYQRYGVYIKAVVKYGKKTYKSAVSGGYHEVSLKYR